MLKKPPAGPGEPPGVSGSPAGEALAPPLPNVKLGVTPAANTPFFPPNGMDDSEPAFPPKDNDDASPLPLLSPNPMTGACKGALDSFWPTLAPSGSNGDLLLAPPNVKADELPPKWKVGLGIALFGWVKALPLVVLPGASETTPPKGFIVESALTDGPPKVKIGLISELGAGLGVLALDPKVNPARVEAMSFVGLPFSSPNANG